MSTVHSTRDAVSPDRNPSDIAKGRYKPFCDRTFADSSVVMPDSGSLSALPRQEQFRILERLVGWTPLVRVGELGLHRGIRQKLEYLNPSGSHYARAYLANIRQLEENGLIFPGTRLRDITSGSAGISLAFFGEILGYRTRITVPDELPETRVKPAEQCGAEIVRSGPGYVSAAHDFQKKEIIKMMRAGWARIKPEDPDMRAVILEKYGERVCYVNHSENSATPRSFESIGHEIVAQNDSARRPGAIILALGNFTTVRGIHDAIKPIWPKTRIVGYDGGPREVHTNYGTSVTGLTTRFMDAGLLDERFTVSEEERDKMRDRINNAARPKEHHVGNSSLMGLVVADMLASERGEPVVCVAYDRANRY